MFTFSISSYLDRLRIITTFKKYSCNILEYITERRNSTQNFPLLCQINLEDYEEKQKKIYKKELRTKYVNLHFS